jgi:endonuclease III
MPSDNIDEEVQERAEAVSSVAVEECGELKSRKIRPPLDQLALSIFFRETSYRRSIRALRQLNRNFVDWNEVRISPEEEVVDRLSSSASWAWESARSILELLHSLYEKQNHLSLRRLIDDRTTTQARRFLRDLPPVDREMANEVLMLSFDLPLFPCPGKIARLTHRVGLLDDGRPLARNQRRLTDLFDSEYYPALHRFLLNSAGKHCTGDDPDCNRCKLEKVCESAE